MTLLIIIKRFCRYCLLGMFLILLVGCASEKKMYGIPMSEWQRLTPHQQQVIAQKNHERAAKREASLEANFQPSAYVEGGVGV